MDEKKNLKKVSKYRKLIFWFIGLFLLGFILLNSVAAFQAWSFTHFIEPNNSALELNENSSFRHKLESIVFGVEIPKPQNTPVDLDFIEVDTISGKVNLEVWRFDMEPSLGVVALFHGYKSSKSALWKEAQAFYRMGYTVILVDFRASGNSDGNQCTIGYFEALDVDNTLAWCTENYPNQKIFLYGISMGAAAILRSVSELDSNPDGIIVQSSFSNMLATSKNRFELMGIPSFPSAHLLTFWGGYLNDFNAFEHNPSEYAKNVNCPTLLIHGMLDNRVSWKDSKEIFENLKGEKEFGVFSKSGHESILNHEEANWVYLVTNFMQTHNH
jgi:alpha-beta hydrolase superfamily lysophospholipase